MREREREEKRERNGGRENEGGRKVKLWIVPGHHGVTNASHMEISHARLPVSGTGFMNQNVSSAFILHLLSFHFIYIYIYIYINISIYLCVYISFERM